uniref:Derlin n=1 Tax=Ananas comosus var. bracteatus TaxID=296719 RepID=A0A6V7QBS5_ANACO|nr:unnamed protein product [Ananas comosus var. bracteatus]
MSQHVPELNMPTLLLGDIAISVETATHQAKERGHELLDEIRILMVDLDFLFHMFFLARYCKILEENSFRGRIADFFYMLLFGATVLTGRMIPYISETFAKIFFVSNSLTFMMVSHPVQHLPFALFNP